MPTGPTRGCARGWWRSLRRDTLPRCATRRPTWDADLIAGCLASSARRVLLEDATDITAPTLLVRGSDDPFVSDSDVQILAARLAAAEVFTLPDAGHWPSLEAPDELRAELVRFFGL